MAKIDYQSFIIVFFNRFVELEELMRFIGAADIYLTPYLTEAQITSGTLSNAVAMGKGTTGKAYMPGARIIPDDEVLDLRYDAHDLVIHAMGLHWANDLVGQLVQCRRALQPDGLFLFASDIDDYVAMNWLEWNGGGLRLTTTGDNVCKQLAPRGA